MMKKVCGYLDNNGRFHKTKFEVSNSNIDNEIRKLQNKIEEIDIVFYRYIDKHLVYPDGAINNNIVKYVIKRLITDYYTRLVDFHERKEKIEKEVDRLNSLRELPKILRKDWYLNYIIYE